jgi:hypothetical protein
MNLSSGTQSLIAGALFDFVAHLTTLPKTLQAAASEEVYDIDEVLGKWATERELDLERADVRGWSNFTSDADDIQVVGDEPTLLGPRIAGALRSFAEYAALADSPDLENVLFKWASKTGLQIHDPQRRWN